MPAAKTDASVAGQPAKPRKKAKGKARTKNQADANRSTTYKTGYAFAIRGTKEWSDRIRAMAARHETSVIELIEGLLKKCNDEDGGAPLPDRVFPSEAPIALRRKGSPGSEPESTPATDPS